MNVLGISAFYHDSAAALVRGGDIVAAAQEERFTRIKHDASFPTSAVQYCLSQGGIGISEVDYFAYYEKPGLKFTRIMENHIGFAPKGLKAFAQAMPKWLQSKLHPVAELSQALDYPVAGRCFFVEHHRSHAASAFYPSPFTNAAVLTIDGTGEWATTTLGVGDGDSLNLTHEIRYPHSLGLLYSAFTHYTGFKVNSGEYKMMGLAPYGEPIFAQRIYDHLIDLKADGSFWLNMAYFNFGAGQTMTNDRFHDLMGGAPRVQGSSITQRHMDLAASIQSVTEEAMIRLARQARRLTASPNLVLAGGVSLNCVGNATIAAKAGFDSVWIQPASGDAGGTIGAALDVWYQSLGGRRKVSATDSLQGSKLGPAYSDGEVEQFLQSTEAVYTRFDTVAQLTHGVAELLAEQAIVGWFQGRMEFGPRALGGRSILGDPRADSTQKIMNLKTKHRESFRPFAPSVLAEHAADYFDLPGDNESPYMLLVAQVAQAKRLTVNDAQTGFEQLYQRRSTIPAVTHVDYSARVQTVDRTRDPLFHELISAFHQITGCPMVVNTSFNIRGEPIVCSPEDAYRCFMATHMDVLVMGSYVLRKSEQPEMSPFAASQYRDSFELD